MAKKLTSDKAKKILHDKSVHGHPLTDKQRRFFGAIAGGAPMKAQTGLEYSDDLDYFGTYDAINKKGDYTKERQSVINQLSNLPIYSPEQRYMDYQTVLPYWKRNLETVPIYSGNKTPSNGSSYYGYGAPLLAATKPYEGTVQLDPRQFGGLQTPERVLEHELRHAAFDGRHFIPQFYGEALHSTSRKPQEFYEGAHENLLNERAVMALGTRKAIIDKYGLKPDAKIPRELFDAYNRETLETGLRSDAPPMQFSDIEESFRGARSASDVYDLINFNTPKKENGGWLDKYGDGGTMQEYQENYNDNTTSYPPGFVGMGNNTKGRNYSPAWGGQFKYGGELGQAQTGISFLPEQDPEMIYKNKFNTELNKEEKKEFNEWITKESKRQGRDILMDKGAYDVQGFWKSGDYKKMDKDNHGVDTWKKPNHPTFSNQSKYHGVDGFYGGNWTEEAGYQPSKQTADMYSPDYYKWMFSREPNRPEHLDNSRFESGANSPSPLYYAMGGSLPQAQRGISCPTNVSGCGDIGQQTGAGRFLSNIGDFLGVGHGDERRERRAERRLRRKERRDSRKMNNLDITREDLEKMFNDPSYTRVPSRSFQSENDYYNYHPYGRTYSPFLRPVTPRTGPYYTGPATDTSTTTTTAYPGQGLGTINDNSIVSRYISPETNTPENIMNQGRLYNGVPGGVSERSVLTAAMGASIPGAVGFTYARTNSPAPSNGPYAKKTKASAQDGKAIHPTDLRLPKYEKPKPFFTGYGFSVRPVPNVDVHGVGIYGTGNINDRLNLSGNVNSASVFYPGGNKMFMNPRFEVGMKYKFDNGGSMSYYQHGLDWKPKSISKNGDDIPKNQNAQYTIPRYDMPRAVSESTGINRPNLVIENKVKANPVSLNPRVQRQNKLIKRKGVEDKNYAIVDKVADSIFYFNPTGENITGEPIITGASRNDIDQGLSMKKWFEQNNTTNHEDYFNYLKANKYQTTPSGIFRIGQVRENVASNPDVIGSLYNSIFRPEREQDIHDSRIRDYGRQQKLLTLIDEQGIGSSKAMHGTDNPVRINAFNTPGADRHLSNGCINVGGKTVCFDALSKGSGVFILPEENQSLLDYKPTNKKKNGGWLEKYEVPKNQNAQFVLPNPRDIARQNMGSNESTSLGTKIDEAALRQAAISKQRRNQGEIRQAGPKRSLIDKAIAIATNPMTALKYKIKGQDIPENFERGERNPLDYAMDIINPATIADAAVNIPGNIARGEFLQAGANALSVLPMASEFVKNPLVRDIAKTTRDIPRAESITEAIGRFAGIPLKKDIPRMAAQDVKALRQVQEIGRLRATGSRSADQMKYALENNLPEEHFQKVFNRSKKEAQQLLDSGFGEPANTLSFRTLSEDELDQLEGFGDDLDVTPQELNEGQRNLMNALFGDTDITPSQPRTMSNQSVRELFSSQGQDLDDFVRNASSEQLSYFARVNNITEDDIINAHLGIGDIAPSDIMYRAMENTERQSQRNAMRDRFRALDAAEEGRSPVVDVATEPYRSHSDMAIDRMNEIRESGTDPLTAIRSGRVNEILNNLSNSPEYNNIIEPRAGRTITPAQKISRIQTLPNRLDDLSQNLFYRSSQRYPYYSGKVQERVPLLHLSSQGGLKDVSKKVNFAPEGIKSGDVFTGSTNTSHSSYLPQLKQVFKYTKGDPKFLGYYPMNQMGFLSNFGYGAEDISKYLNSEIDEQIKRGILPKDIQRPFLKNESVILPHYGIKQHRKGGVIEDDMGQWAHPGKVTKINSNQITMKGVPYPVLGISDEGDTKMMYPEQEYTFKGKTVTEYPQKKKNGGWLDKYN